ncbi:MULTISPECIES: DUF305 domain-containing protein [unclassified Phormidesmis]
MIRHCFFQGLFQRLFQLLAIALILLKLQPFPALADELSHPHFRHSKTSSQVSQFVAFSKAMEVGMKKMMTEMHQIDTIGEPDINFLVMMIPHHEGAVEMARLVLLYGRDPLVRQLAGEIIASQQVEVAAMQARLLMLKKGENLEPDDFPAIHGTRGMAMLDSLSY